MYGKLKVSVILPTYDEVKSIRKSVLDLERTHIVDEILVINNNAKPGTSEALKGTSALEIFESVQGYGAAIQKGFKVARGSLIVVSEPDGTFVADDILKLLSYTHEFDMVLGSRTTQALIWEGANMGFFLKWGNYLVAKLIEFIFNTNSLTDAGCTYRVIKKNALKKVQPFFRIRGGHFGIEMILLGVKKELSFIQIPVNYKKRIGQSHYTGTLIDAFSLGFKMVGYIFNFWINHSNHE